MEENELPKDLWKYIVHLLNDDLISKRLLISSLPVLFRSYTAEERYFIYNIDPVVLKRRENRRQCSICSCFIFVERYESHTLRCKVRHKSLCVNNCAYLGTPIQFPWHSKDTPCPFFKCIHCKNHIVKKNKSIHTYLGCTACKQYICDVRYCSICDSVLPLCYFEEHECFSVFIPKLIKEIIKLGLHPSYERHEIFNNNKYVHIIFHDSEISTVYILQKDCETDVKWGVLEYIPLVKSFVFVSLKKLMANDFDNMIIHRYTPKETNREVPCVDLPIQQPPEPSPEKYTNPDYIGAKNYEW